MAHRLDKGDYFEAKAALLEANIAIADAERLKARAQAKAQATFTRLGLTDAARYDFDDATLTITPHTGG
jgi:hypothetical protein